MSPKDLCTIEFIDKMISAGVSVLKIEGRARSAEYVKTVTASYRKGVDAVLNGTFTPEYAAGLKKDLETVFNRGFWDGYYQGARLGQWSEVYGSKATRQKTYIGKVTNYFSNIGVSEILVEAAPISVGDTLMVIGSTTGVVEFVIPEIRVALKPADTCVQGTYCSIPISDRIRRGDKVYKLTDRL